MTNDRTPGHALETETSEREDTASLPEKCATLTRELAEARAEIARLEHAAAYYCAPDCHERAVCSEPGATHTQCGTCQAHDAPRHHCGCPRPLESVRPKHGWDEAKLSAAVGAALETALTLFADDEAGTRVNSELHGALLAAVLPVVRAHFPARPEQTALAELLSDAPDPWGQPRAENLASALMGLWDAPADLSDVAQ